MRNLPSLLILPLLACLISSPAWSAKNMPTSADTTTNTSLKVKTPHKSKVIHDKPPQTAPLNTEAPDTLDKAKRPRTTQTPPANNTSVSPTPENTSSPAPPSLPPRHTAQQENPIPSHANTDPTQGATAHCKDGTFSHSKQHSGTCSRHGGVERWLQQ